MHLALLIQINHYPKNKYCSDVVNMLCHTGESITLHLAGFPKLFSLVNSRQYQENQVWAFSGVVVLSHM